MNKTRITRRVAAIAATLAAAALVVAGCSATPEETSGDVEQTLRIGSTRATFTSLDSGALSGGGYEGQRLVGNTIYEGLTRKDISDPDTVAPVDAPALAESWDISEDGLAYTFHLREGVTFHDGTPWDADAAIFNFDRYMDEANPYYDATVSANYGVLSRITSIDKVDEMTITLHLGEPYAYFLGEFYVIYFASPTSLETDGTAGQAVRPVGTGPFAFESQNGDEDITLVRNEEYWGEVPRLETLQIVNIPDSAARIAALRSDRVDWIEGVSPDDIPSLESAGFIVTQKLFDWVWFWSYDVEKEPFDDQRVRLALNFAIDREAIADSLLNGTAVPLRQIMPEVNPLYDPADDLYEYDPELARDLLAEAGYPDGFEMVLSYPDSGSGYMMPREMNEALQAQLAEIGVDVTFVVEDNPSYNALAAAGEATAGARMAAGTMDLYSTWNGYLFGCGVSRWNYCNEDVSTILEEAEVTVDDDERGALLQEAAALLTVDAPRLSVVSDTAPRAMSSRVQGYEQPRHWWIDFNDIYMD